MYWSLFRTITYHTGCCQTLHPLNRYQTFLQNLLLHCVGHWIFLPKLQVQCNAWKPICVKTIVAVMPCWIWLAWSVFVLQSDNHQTIFGSKRRDATTAEHFPKPLKVLEVLAPILYWWILTTKKHCTVLYTVVGVKDAPTDTVLYTVWGSERVNRSKMGDPVSEGLTPRGQSVWVYLVMQAATPQLHSPSKGWDTLCALQRQVWSTAVLASHHDELPHPPLGIQCHILFKRGQSFT